MAGKIMAWRQEHGQFASVDQLREISGIGAKTFEKIKPHVTI
jgi:comEA protein